METLKAAEGLLIQMNFVVLQSSTKGQEFLVFEDATVLGFLFTHESVETLLGGWETQSQGAIAMHQLALRRAGPKAWNTYVVLLAKEDATESQLAALSAIEEDLTGTRKIARASIKDTSDLNAAMLPLLPLQSAPILDAVDMVMEIRQRATELPARAIEAFVSGADESVVLQVIEEAQ